MGFSDYIKDLLRQGKCSFTIQQAQSAMGKSLKAIYSSVEHLLAKGEIVTPAKGFYVIVPPEYQILGCLPAEHFIPYLMEHWQCPYYVGLLTAARYHGATHQAVQVFQVMIEGRSRPQILCGKVRVRFIANRHLAETPVQTISTAKSMLKVSTPESTAMDLFNYPHQAGGLNHIATVLAELHESIRADKLLALAESKSSFAWKQRLGYLLENVGASELAEVLKKHLAQQKRVDYVPLMPRLEESNETPRNSTWKIIENATVESDI
jgi:predicted transcriptional regulator of viral defense system